MTNITEPSPSTDDVRAMHLRITEPSPWIARFQHLIRKEAQVLDVAAGGGRHGRMFLERGACVTFIDRDTSGLCDLLATPAATVIEADLESKISPFGEDGPLAKQIFDAIIVVNYLHRPLLNVLIESLTPGGLLIYETFACGNEIFARPRNPNHLLKSGELLTAVAGKMQVVAYEHGQIEAGDIPGVKQRLCAVKNLDDTACKDGDSPAHSLVLT